MLLNGEVEGYRNRVIIQRDQGFLNLVDQIVSLNLAARDFDLTVLSTQLALSKRQIQRRMKALVGCTPSGYIRSYRLQESLKLLEKGMPVSQVARAVGFSSQAYFASCFRAEFDQTPSGYQRRQC